MLRYVDIGLITSCAVQRSLKAAGTQMSNLLLLSQTVEKVFHGAKHLFIFLVESGWLMPGFFLHTQDMVS